MVPFNETAIDPRILAILDKIKAKYRCCILSNVPSSEDSYNRIKLIERQSGLPTIHSIKKKTKLKEAFLAASNFLGYAGQDVAFIGDRIFTDIFGANLVGILSVLVTPLNWRKDPFFMVTLPRVVEQIFIRSYAQFLRIKLNEVKAL